MPKHLGRLFLIAIALAGCDSGPKLYQAGGTVHYNGAPLPGANVTFMAEESSSPSIGRTDEQGRFSLATAGRQGAPPGSYKVAITAVRQKRPVTEAEAVGMTSEQIAANHESMIPNKYNNFISSGLTATVEKNASANDFVFDLK